MDSLNIELNGSEVASIACADGTLRLRFSRAILVKSMTGSVEKTRWWQAGTLAVEGVENPPASLPAGPLVCLGGDIEENIYTYRDMLPVPFASRGRVGCALRFAGRPEPLVVVGTAIGLEMEDVPKYIEHLRPAG